jgi:hypothetical protein
MELYIYYIFIYGIVILPIFYGYESWSLTLREELRMMVFEKRVLRMIFWSSRDEATRSGKDCITRNFMLFYFSLNIIRAIKSRRMLWAWYVA